MTTPTAYTTRDSGFLVMRFQYLMMLDWDVLNLASPNTYRHCTAQNRKEVALRLYDRCYQQTQELWAIYYTHSGVHAFQIDARIPTRSKAAIETAISLKCDPLYLKFSRQRELWSARIEPKPGRNLDRIHFKGFIGSGKCHPENLTELEMHHAELIKNGMTYSNLPTPSQFITATNYSATIA